MRHASGGMHLRLLLHWNLRGMNEVEVHTPDGRSHSSQVSLDASGSSCTTPPEWVDDAIKVLNANDRHQVIADGEAQQYSGRTP